MARFYGDWEREFRPQWEIAKDLSLGVGQVGGASDPRNSKVSLFFQPTQQIPMNSLCSKSICQRCGGIGRVVCYACGGSGKVSAVTIIT